MSFAVKPDSLADVSNPMLFIKLGKEHGWLAGDVSASGSNLVAKVKDASLAVFAPAYHLTFLAECEPGAAKLLEEMDDDPICTDPVGTDRSLVHRQIADEIATFLDLP